MVGFALTLAKWRQTRRVAPPADYQLAEFNALVKDKDYGKAVNLGSRTSSLAVRVGIAVVRQAGMAREPLKDHAELVGRQVIRELEYGLGGLALIATLGPLFGLLGTVVGIILIFGQLTATGGLASPSQLAGGIGTALYTTVAGLIVGVVAAARVDRIVADLESTTLEVIELVCEDAA